MYSNPQTVLLCLWVLTTSLLFAVTAANTQCNPVSQPCPNLHRHESQGIFLCSQTFIFQSKAYLSAHFQRQTPLIARSCLSASLLRPLRVVLANARPQPQRHFPAVPAPSVQEGQSPDNSAGLLLPPRVPREGTVSLAAWQAALEPREIQPRPRCLRNRSPLPAFPQGWEAPGEHLGSRLPRVGKGVLGQAVSNYCRQEQERGKQEDFRGVRLPRDTPSVTSTERTLRSVSAELSCSFFPQPHCWVCQGVFCSYREDPQHGRLGSSFATSADNVLSYHAPPSSQHPLPLQIQLIYFHIRYQPVAVC